MLGRVINIICVAILIAVIQFIVGLNANGLAIVISGALMGLLPFGLWKLTAREDELYWPVCAALIGIILGGPIMRMLRPDASDVLAYDLFAIGAGALTSGLLLFKDYRHISEKCDCCRRPLFREKIFCPRGKHWICSNCWHQESFRCLDCKKLGTPLLDHDDSEWWHNTVGKKISAGNCTRCGASVNERNLHRCKECTWPMCTNCWDMENGSCVRCGWEIPEMKEFLKKKARVESGELRVES